MSSQVAAAQPHSALPQPPRRRPALLLMALITIPVLVLDQVTKHFVMAHMALYQSLPIVRHYLDITYTLNPGAAFSMFAESLPWLRTALLIALSTTASIVLVVLLIRAQRISLTTVSFALILAGASGNLIDRATRAGRVVDFIRVHYYDLNYPIFNVADSAISVGVTLLIVASLFGLGDDGRPAPTG